MDDKPKDVLKLFSLCDGDFDVDPTSTWSLAVWAENAKQALQFALDNKLYDGGYKREEFIENFEIYEYEGGRLAEFAPAQTEAERRDEVLRLAGWGLDDEDRCLGCDLYAMGLDAYYVCGVCGFCLECGHDEECAERSTS